MKLVEILAAELSEWKEDAHIVMQDNDSDKTIWFLEKDHEFVAHDGFEWKCDSYFKIMINRPIRLASDYKTAIVTESQWQAERDRQKGGEWKRHRGGKQPVFGGKVEVKFRDGDVEEWFSDSLDWNHNGKGRDIMKYKIISQQQAEEVEVKDTTIGTMSYKAETDTTEANQAIDELASKWDQVDGPLRWRDCVNELDAYIEEFTRERDALIERLASEGFALIPAMTPVVGVADLDMSDWRNWKEGDLITFTQESEADFTKGKQYVFEPYESQDHEISIVADDIGDPNGWKPEFFEWHSRP